MPNYTENYNLKKPLPNEYYNVQDQNDNMDIIDTALKAHDDALATKETPEGAQEKADAALNSAKQYTDQKVGEVVQELAAHLEDLTQHKDINLKLYRLNKDSEGIFTELQWKRPDNTLAIKSVLSGGTTPKYTTRTEIYYEADGTTIKATKIYTLSYDSDDEIISEV